MTSAEAGGERWPSAAENALVVLARQPEPGRVKTRLAASFGEAAAAELYRAFLDDLARRLAGSSAWTLLWSFTPASAPFAREIARGAAAFPQTEGDLGERMAAAMDEAWRRGYRRVALIGSDVPHLPRAHVEEAFRRLERGERLVLGPASDGGYVLVGATVPMPIFSGVHWGSSSVLDETLERARAAGIEPALLPETYDVDSEADLHRLERDIDAGAADLPAIRAALERLGRLRYSRRGSGELPNVDEAQSESRPPAFHVPSLDRKSAERLWGDFRTAIGALSILGKKPPEAARVPLGTSAIFYPAVGFLIGAVVALFDWVLRATLTQEIASVFLVAALAVLSGGRQIEGFANAADGVIGFRGRQWALATIHDRRLGTSGAAAIVFLLLLKVRSFDLLSDPVRVVALVIAPMMGRLAMTVLAYASRDATASGEGRRFDPDVGLRELAGAGAFALVVAGVFGGAVGVLVMIAAMAAATGLRFYLDKRLGGLTFQSLDAAAEVTETLALIVFAVMT